MSKDDILQSLARKYLRRLRKDAKSIGMEGELDRIIEANENGMCVADKKQVDKLSRMFQDDKIKYYDIPEILHTSKRRLEEGNIIKKSIRKFKDYGSFSKIDTLMLKDKIKKER